MQTWLLLQGGWVNAASALAWMWWRAYNMWLLKCCSQMLRFWMMLELSSFGTPIQKFSRKYLKLQQKQNILQTVLVVTMEYWKYCLWNPAPYSICAQWNSQWLSSKDTAIVMSYGQNDRNFSWLGFLLIAFWDFCLSLSELLELRLAWFVLV